MRDLAGKDAARQWSKFGEKKQDKKGWQAGKGRPAKLGAQKNLPPGSAPLPRFEAVARIVRERLETPLTLQSVWIFPLPVWQALPGKRYRKTARAFSQRRFAGQGAPPGGAAKGKHLVKYAGQSRLAPIAENEKRRQGTAAPRRAGPARLKQIERCLFLLTGKAGLPQQKAPSSLNSARVNFPFGGKSRRRR